jgi:hypothetical protein
MNAKLLSLTEVIRQMRYTGSCETCLFSAQRAYDHRTRLCRKDGRVKANDDTCPLWRRKSFCAG